MEHPSNEYTDLVDLVAHKESKAAEMDRFVQLLRKWSGVFLLGVSLLYAGLFLFPLSHSIDMTSMAWGESKASISVSSPEYYPWTQTTMSASPKPPLEQSQNFLAPPPNWRKLRVGEIVTYDTYGCMGLVSSFVIYP
ncbi:MAG: hypothetical protein AAFQ68_24250 [Bacteroidota bacterium]